MTIPPMGMWVAVILTIFMYSLILYKDNPLYKIAEAALMGTSIANVAVMAVKSLFGSGFTPLINGNYSLIIPLLLGLLVFTTYSKTYRKLSYWPIAVMSGVGIALAIRGGLHANVYKMIEATAGSIIVPNNPMASVNKLIVLIGTIASISYFFYTFKPTKNLERAQKLGRYFLMAFFGVIFGNVVMTRISYLTGRIQSLVEFFSMLFFRSKILSLFLF